MIVFKCFDEIIIVFNAENKFIIDFILLPLICFFFNVPQVRLFFFFFSFLWFLHISHEVLSLSRVCLGSCVGLPDKLTELRLHVENTEI